MDTIKRIKELMEERNWTTYRLIKNSNLPPATVSNIFNRNTIPSIPTLEIICDAFGITLSQFFAEGDFVSLTEEQSALLKQWSTLTAEQKKILLDLMSKMNP